MSKLLATVATIAILFTTIPSAKAGDKDLMIGILGGALGAIILTDAHKHRHHHRREYVHSYPKPRYVSHCYTKYVRMWDPYYRAYVMEPRTFCD